MPTRRYPIGAALASLVVCTLHAAPAAAVPVFARIYDKPCGTCHTVFPQLNPAGENFRAHGFHGLTPAFEPVKVGDAFDVPGTLPVALYLATGENVSRVDVPGQPDPTRTHFNLDFFRILAGGELGRHVSFLLDWELIETEPDTGEVEIFTVPYQAYAMVHAEPRGWLANLKTGWYELPLTVSPTIHRLSVRPYLIYGLNACTILDVEPPHGLCEDEPTLDQPQISLEVNALRPERGFGWAAGFTNGSNEAIHGPASPDMYLHATQALGPGRVGLFLRYSPDLVGGGVHDHALRLGPAVDVYSRQLRLFGQFLAAWESNPTGHDDALWFYGGFLEVDYRLTVSLLSVLRVDYAWTPRFDDRGHGGNTDVERQLWEITGGGQWLIFDNLKVVAELTYGQDREAGDRPVEVWAATVRLVTAFWPLTPPGLNGWFDRREAP